MQEKSLTLGKEPTNGTEYMWQVPSDVLLFESLKIHDVLNIPTWGLNYGAPDKIDVIVWAEVFTAECGDKSSTALGG